MLNQLDKDKKIVIYTVIMGDYDYLKDPDFITDNCDYVCFTNNPKITSTVWEIRLDVNDDIDNTRWQRRHKVLAHEYLPEYDISIYVDGNVRILGDFREYISKFSQDSSILCLKHPDRDCIYEEAEVCKELKKDNSELIDSQIEKYRKSGYPEHNGLVVSNVLVREHNNPSVIELMESWWEEIENGSRRDQLSFNYVCWKQNFRYDISELKCWRSEYWSNPGIHTSNIRAVEDELINTIQYVANLKLSVLQKENYIKLKEQELKDANTQLGWKEQELKDANTQLGWKQNEIELLNNKYNRTIIGRIKNLYKRMKSNKGYQMRSVNKDFHSKFEQFKPIIERNKSIIKENPLGIDKVILDHFEEHHGYRFDLNNPKTFNEKLAARKKDSNPLFIKCADKIKVRRYVEKKVGKQYLIPVYYTGRRLYKSVYKRLPEEFVAKTSSGSGTIDVIRHKSLIQYEDLRDELNDWLSVEYGYIAGEMFYNRIPKGIIIEKLLIDSNGKVPNDYKFHCFRNDGNNEIFLQIIHDRFDGRSDAIYDLDYNRLNVTIGHENYSGEDIKPKNFDEMVRVAKRLSEDFEYSRIDLYNIDGRIYFGEITFIPDGAGCDIIPHSFDELWGKWWG